MEERKAEQGLRRFRASGLLKEVRTLPLASFSTNTERR
jgi:hypothetical protein